ncbi:hypothetical protein MKUB_35710 [Mycobacterium kubicae]|uniref:PE domain-containing protein n=1 Tax=Mycobacterium kubicae TaxID=120959 RepID=A0ABQ1BQV2_9MYCO|nr:hypothetical protein AWC13_14025 [Mycobacterium kubicae]QNI14116.1 PE family protein [Mycobacterium kubicae]GFG66081.1 hypothetical protein MKUB_35710 [Mycobacterium kubicae]
MSYLLVTPTILSAVAGEADALGTAISAASAAAAAATTGVLPPAADEVSIAVAALLNAHGRSCQAIRAQAVAFQHHFAQTLAAAAGSHPAAEAGNGSPLPAFKRERLEVSDTPTDLSLRHPSVGSGADGGGGTRGWVLGIGATAVPGRWQVLTDF